MKPQRKYNSNFLRDIVFELVFFFVAYHIFSDITEFLACILAVNIAYYLGMGRGVKAFQEGMREGQEIARGVEEEHRLSERNQ